jgi:hypothetical protein
LGAISIWEVLFFSLFIWLLPWVMALASTKAKGSHKVIWFLMSFLISWLGYLVYYFTVIKNLPENNIQQY